MTAPEGAPTSPAPLILVVEDEMMVAMMLEDMLTELGYRVLKAARVGKAVTLASTEALDGTILDLNVAGEPVYLVAEQLRARGIPFIFATGYGAEGLRCDYQDCSTLRKPFHFTELKRIVAATLAHLRAVCTLSAPFETARCGRERSLD